MDVVKTWEAVLALIATGFSVAAIAGRAIKWILKPYIDKLKVYQQLIDSNRQLLDEQRQINQCQQNAIKASIQDREDMRRQLAGIVDLLLTTARMELEKVSERAIRRGSITAQEQTYLNAMFPPYKANGGNHGLDGKYEAAIRLPLMDNSQSKNQNEGGNHL